MDEIREDMNALSASLERFRQTFDEVTNAMYSALGGIGDEPTTVSEDSDNGNGKDSSSSDDNGDGKKRPPSDHSGDGKSPTSEHIDASPASEEASNGGSQQVSSPPADDGGDPPREVAAAVGDEQADIGAFVIEVLIPDVPEEGAAQAAAPAVGGGVPPQGAAPDDDLAQADGANGQNGGANGQNGGASGAGPKKSPEVITLSD